MNTAARATAFLAATLAFAMVMSKPAVADEEYIHCISEDGQSETRYYSAIFLEDYSRSIRWENEFHDYLEDRNSDPDRAATWCFFEKKLSSAEREYDRHARDDDDSYDVVHTNWAPETFSSVPLRDFNIEVSSHNREIEVCVRDHECEDGDRVQVSVNGDRIFSGEIDNDWICEIVDVREGNNRVKLYAVNGTGRKGNCSYADANTGEIRVEGKNSETQSWQHRGGAGSSANIVVTVD